jgi:hypothetical protein
MSHHLPQHDRLIEWVARLEIGQVTRDGCIQIEGAALNELHDGDIGKQLRQRTDTINRFSRGRDFRLGIGEAETARSDNALIVHQGDR